jgi:hypothetical protein
MVGEYAHPTWFGIPARLNVPPFTLSLSPEYEGEGTGAGLGPDRGGTPRL